MLIPNQPARDRVVRPWMGMNPSRFIERFTDGGCLLNRGVCGGGEGLVGVGEGLDGVGVLPLWNV